MKRYPGVFKASCVIDPHLGPEKAVAELVRLHVSSPPLHFDCSPQAAAWLDAQRIVCRATDGPAFA
eukprot:COSAG04_NODE_168_length_21684_cov_19.787121_3_plen_66_part_00